MATLTRYRPFQPIRTMQREIDRLFGEYLPFFGDEELEKGVWSPTMDLTETETEYVVKMDVPGISKQDITVNLQDHMLVVSGERKEEKKEKTESRLVYERRFGSFYRSLSLPHAARDEEISAEMHEGVLTIHVKKSEEAKPRRIEIQ